ncbi:hypothetical protein [Bacteroides fragilis]|uniref:hypothetical protein n=1 Tax=Bacteroides fragilis TaxID=817 RepID=UPI00321BF42D
MKVSINQVKINRVGINTAQVRGIRLSSAVADRGHKVDFPFSDSLIDYWNFKGKNNSDEDRDTIKGIKGGILTAYNFGWISGSGYGLYKNDFTKWTSQFGSINTKTTSYFDIDNINSPVKSNVWLDLSKPTDGSTYIHPSFKIRISGLNGSFATLKYREDGVNKNIQMGDGIHVIPSASEDRFSNTDKLDIYEFYIPRDRHIRIEEIPEYEGAIVTDGVDDYLKLDKVGYKVGTVIIKYIPISIHAGWNTVFDTYNDVYENKCLMFYNRFVDNWGSTMKRKIVNDYSVFVSDTPKNVDVPLYLGARYEKTVKDYLNMALYSIAIYDRALSDQEVQEVINFINYGTTNPIFALNFDNFAYRAVDYPDFATGKVTTNKIVVDSTTETFNGAIAVAMNPEADTGEPIEVPSYKIKVTGLNQYSVGEGNWAVGLMGMMIDSTKDPWTYPISKDGVYDIPAISLSDGIYNLGIMAQIAIDKPIEIEVLYDKNVTKSFPENKQIFP